MNAVTEKTELDQHQVGLYHKFNVTRTDGSSAPGGKHEHDDYFVLNLTTDRHVVPALKAYAKSCADDYPALASDLRAKIRSLLPSEFVTVPEIVVPEITLDDGKVIESWTEPSFKISRYLCTVDADGKATVQADGVPTVEINYYDSIAACENAKRKLITERQHVALSWLLTQVGMNWTGGEVGVGDLRQGLRKGSVNGPQRNDYVPADPDEDRRFYLPNGEVFYDHVGHLCTWVSDNVQGDDRGLIAKPFAANSISIATAPYPSMTRGMGYRPAAGANWSGYALVRGGCWLSGGGAGVFGLGGDGPAFGSDDVGFRCTE